MTARSIFFSYSRADSKFVLELAKQLRDAGADVWLDQLDIEPGTNWDDSIEEALQKSETLLVVLSKTSVASQNVRDEYSYAIEEGKRVVPVLLEDCTIPFRLRRLQYADFSTSSETGMQTLIETLSLDANKVHEVSEIVGPAKSKKTSTKFSQKQLRILALLVFAVTLFFIFTKVVPAFSSSTSQVTVLVHDEAGKDQLVLPNRGQVKLIYGDANVIETINAKGEATFKQIPSAFFNEDASVEILFMDPEGEPYRSLTPDSLFQLSEDSYIALPVKLMGLEKVYGIVKDFESGDPVENVRISISGVDAFSNGYGEYELTIPKELQRKYQTIRAFKEGYDLFELQNVPIQTDAELPIVLKPKN